MPTIFSGWRRRARISAGGGVPTIQRATPRLASPRRSRSLLSVMFIASWAPAEIMGRPKSSPMDSRKMPSDEFVQFVLLHGSTDWTQGSARKTGTARYSSCTAWLAPPASCDPASDFDWSWEASQASTGWKLDYSCFPGCPRDVSVSIGGLRHMAVWRQHGMSWSSKSRSPNEGGCDCMYACMHVCILYAYCMHACMHVCMHACMYVCMYACMHVCMYACMHVCMHAFMYVCNMYVICMYNVYVICILCIYIERERER